MSNIESNYDDLIKIADSIDKKVNADEILKKISELPSNNGVETAPSNVTTDKQLEKVVKLHEIDTATGRIKILGDTDDLLKRKSNVGIYNLLNYDGDDFDINKAKVNQDLLKDNIKNMYEVSDEDAKALLDIVNKYRQDQSINVYALLPPSLKRQLDTECMQNGTMNKQLRKMLAKELVDRIIREGVFDQLIIDYNEEINNAINKDIKPELADSFIDNIYKRKKYMYDMAEKLDEEQHSDKAMELRAIGDMSEDSYTYERYKEAIRSHKFNIKKFELEKYSRVYTSFLAKYANCRMDINNIGHLPLALKRVMKWSDDDAILFTVAFCKYVNKFSPSNLAEHTFMYYFIANILSIEIYETSNENAFEFYKSLKERIQEVLDLLHKYYINKEDDSHVSKQRC